jgi:hypothetical protein
VQSQEQRNGRGAEHDGEPASTINMQDQPRVDVGACAKHFTERATGRCDDCGHLWCDDCLVPPIRRRQPVRCVGCALIAAGVRTPGARPAGITDLGRHKKRPKRLF